MPARHEAPVQQPVAGGNTTTMPPLEDDLDVRYEVDVDPLVDDFSDARYPGTIDGEVVTPLPGLNPDNDAASTPALAAPDRRPLWPAAEGTPEATPAADAVPDAGGAPSEQPLPRHRRPGGIRSALSNIRNLRSVRRETDDSTGADEPVAIPAANDTPSSEENVSSEQYRSRHRRQGAVRKIANKLNPADLVRRVDARLATNESLNSRRGKAALIIGGIATVGAVGFAVYKAYKGFGPSQGMLANLPSGEENHGTHVASGVAPEPEHVLETDNNPGETAPGGANDHTELTTRTAVSHDPETGRASNVTDWSRDAIFDEARARGFDEQTSHALANDQRNVDTSNNAFYHDNHTVRDDPNHYLDQTTYDTTGQNRAADDILDQYETEHGDNRPAGSDNQPVVADEQANGQNAVENAEQPHAAEPVDQGNQPPVPNEETTVQPTGKPEVAATSAGESALIVTGALAGTAALAGAQYGIRRRAADEQQRQAYEEEHGRRLVSHRLATRRGKKYEGRRRNRSPHSATPDASDDPGGFIPGF